MNMPQWMREIGVPEECVSPESSVRQGKKRPFSLRLQKGEEIWRIQLDGCWMKDSELKKVDYLFWGKSVSGRKIVFLLELKGNKFGDALKQVDQTLERMCKCSPHKGLHNGKHEDSPGHDSHSDGGVRAYVVLSKGVKARQYQSELKRIKKKYGVLVYSREQHITVNGLDNLP